MLATHESRPSVISRSANWRVAQAQVSQGSKPPRLKNCKKRVLAPAKHPQRAPVRWPVNRQTASLGFGLNAGVCAHAGQPAQSRCSQQRDNCISGWSWPPPLSLLHTSTPNPQRSPAQQPQHPIAHHHRHNYHHHHHHHHYNHRCSPRSQRHAFTYSHLRTSNSSRSWLCPLILKPACSYDPNLQTAKWPLSPLHEADLSLPVALHPPFSLRRLKARVEPK